MTNFAKPLDVFKILDLVDKADTDDDKVAVLQKYDVRHLRDVMRGCFDETIGWALPGGKPPYTQNVPESVPSSLQKQTPNFKYFVEGTISKQLTNVKREQLFIQCLESVHPADAEILIKMINKESPSDGTTKELVEQAYPGLIQQ